MVVQSKNKLPLKAYYFRRMWENGGRWKVLWSVFSFHYPAEKQDCVCAG